MRAVFNPLRLGAVTLDVLAAGCDTPHGILKRQRQRLVHLLQVAMRESRLYRERLGGISATDVSLGALPVVRKEELMQRFDDWVTDPQLKLVELRAFIADAQRIAEPCLGKYVVWESSGSSGTPGVFVQDAWAMATYDALEALRRPVPRSLQRLIDPLYLSERVAFVGATGGHFASHVSMQRLRQLKPWMAQSLRSFSILQATGTLIAELNEFAPTVIATYPTVVALLADEASRGSLHIVPHEILTGGETLTPCIRQRVEQVFGSIVHNSYGASEFLSLAWECAHGHLHVNADWAILEPVDEKLRPVPPGHASHSTLLTNLANTLQPLIRYNLGDQITVNPEPCACGSPLPTIQVAGRHDDALTMQRSDGRNVTLLPLALTTLLEDQAGVFDFQLCQRDPHSLELNLSPYAAKDAVIRQRCKTVLQAFAARQGLESIHVIVKSGRLQRGRSGKLQRVVAHAP